MTEAAPQPNEPSDYRHALDRCRALDSLPREILDRVYAACAVRKFDTRDRMIEFGAEGDELLLIVEGYAAASLPSNGEREVIATFGPDEILGEMALVTGEPRTADVHAETPVIALALRAQDFHQLAERHPMIGVLVTRLIGERLGQTERDGLGDKQVDRYVIERCVGTGATSMVYRAKDTDDDSIVALKMMSHRLAYESGALRRFQREADLLLALSHPRVARVYRTFSAYRTRFIVMEFHPGRSLADAIDLNGPMKEREARPLIGQLAAGLRYLHDNGIVHRDLKPGNVMMGDNGATLTDFGLAKCGSNLPSVNQTTSVYEFAGTPAYMAPELMHGEDATTETDLYAFGCLVYELLHGSRAFRSKNLMELIDEKRQFKLPPRRAIGHGISCRMHALLRGSLAPKPGKRELDLAALSDWAG